MVGTIWPHSEGPWHGLTLKCVLHVALAPLTDTFSAMGVGRCLFSWIWSPGPQECDGERDGLTGLLRGEGYSGVQGRRARAGCSAQALPHLPVASRFDDIDLPSAVKYLIASDPNLQVLGAAYLQHKCYSDSNAKKQVST